MFGAEVSLADLSSSRKGDHLVFTLASTGETVTINNHFNTANIYRIEAVELADGTVLDLAQIEIEVATVNGTEAGESLSGFNTNDVS